MFKGSRRRTAPLQPLTKETADPNAATAAASAFMRRETQSLSSAAAAAALRARPTTPTNVAEIPSKRMRRRNSSISSVPSRDGGRKSELQRSPSVGSMIERTFRSPSPARSPAPRIRDAPPVPSIPIPKHVPSTKTTVQQNGIATQTQPFRTASQKAKDGMQGSSWFGAATSRDSVNVRANTILHSPTSSSEMRPGSVSPSINFSYPRARLLSPSGGSPFQSTPDQDLVYDANSRRMVPRSELFAISLSIGDFDKPVKKKKSKKQDASRIRSHLAKGTVERTEVTPLKDVQTSTASAAMMLPEREQESLPTLKGADEPTSDQVTSISSVVLPMPTGLPPLVHQTRRGGAEGECQHNAQTRAIEESSNESRSLRSGVSNIFENEPKSSATAVRVQSQSPSRSARFASPTDQLAVKHEPPPRSLSPRKSAMKLSNSTRGVSPAPSNDESETSVFSPSQSSKEDSAIARKKTVRVSWDDENTIVVGESALLPETELPTIPSPQAKKSWHNIVGKHPKRETVSIDEDETMSPRPALPLFGSVREKKTKEPEERALVRPPEKGWPPKPTLPSFSQAAIARVPKGSFESDDSVIGAIPAQEQPSKHEANTSKYREPLPIAISFTETSEHDSEDSLGSDEELDPQQTWGSRDVALTVNAKELPSNSGNSTSLEQEDPVGYSSNVPTISISQPSYRQQGYDEVIVATPCTAVPGSFPGEFHISTTSEETSLTPSAEPAEPKGVNLVPKMDDIEEEDEESDQGSVYSDAHEDLSTVDGNGFMSLDAILVSPPETKASTITKTNDISDTCLSERQPQRPPQASDDWEKAKAYWKSLPSDKRRQLEKEALEETREEDMLASTRMTPSGNVSTVKGNIPSAPESQIAVCLPGSTKKSMRPSNSPPQSQSGGHRGKPQVQHGKPEITSGEGGRMRTSMRSVTPSAVEPTGFARSLRALGRPASSYHSPSVSEPSQKHQRNHSVDGSGSRSNVVVGTSVEPMLRRRGSDSSESSFTRTRTGVGARHGFRTSLRAGPALPVDGNKGSSRLSLRSLSPTGSAFRHHSAATTPPSRTPVGNQMRQSLRHNSSHSEPPHPRIASFRRISTKKGSRSNSRFEDSSDEDDNYPTFFRSRFDDSSDEEAALAKSKNQGLSKSLRSKTSSSAYSATLGLSSSTTEHGSPDNDYNVMLSERTVSSSGVRSSPPASALKRSRSGRGVLLSPSSLSMNEADSLISPHSPSRRGSFMSILRRKRGAGGKIAREISESAARRDTRLERSTEQLTTIRSNSLRNGGASWPLPDNNDADDGRGNSSGETHGAETHITDIDKPRPATLGAVKADSLLRPGLVGRQSDSQSMANQSHVAGNITLLQGKRKKKFGSLRKIFRLDE